MWSAEDRLKYDRQNLRYPSDLTDGEWALIEPLIPPARRGGRSRSVNVREVAQALMYVLETGCQWRHLPKDFPPRSTVWGYFDLWSYDGALDRIHATLYEAAREVEDREASPTGAIIDSQTVKSTEKGGKNQSPTGYDGAKKIKGVKRHLLVDTLGLTPRVVVHPASIQDRDGALLVLDKNTRRRFPFIEVVFADQGYSGLDTAAAVAQTGSWRLEIVRRDPDQKGFKVLPMRWVVERTLSWIRRNRRLAKDVEHLARTATALVKLAMIKIMIRRLARS